MPYTVPLEAQAGLFQIFGDDFTLFFQYLREFTKTFRMSIVSTIFNNRHFQYGLSKWRQTEFNVLNQAFTVMSIFLNNNFE